MKTPGAARSDQGVSMIEATIPSPRECRKPDGVERRGAIRGAIPMALRADAVRAGRLHRQDGFSLVDMLSAILVVGIVAAMALPMTGSALAAHRFRSDGQSLSNLVALPKRRAAPRFSRARLFVNLANNSYSVQVWDKTARAWVTDGAVMQASNGVTFGVNGLTTPPPNTQAVIGMSPSCTDDDEALIAGTSCIEFNSRGIPIDNAGAPRGGNAFYLTNGTGVYAVTVTATPLVRFWWSSGHAANWVEQQ